MNKNSNVKWWHIHSYGDYRDFRFRSDWSVYQQCRCGKVREVFVAETKIERINL